MAGHCHDLSIEPLGLDLLKLVALRLHLGADRNEALLPRQRIARCASILDDELDGRGGLDHVLILA